MKVSKHEIAMLESAATERVRDRVILVGRK